MSQSIHVKAILAVQILCVDLIIIKRFAHVCQIILADRQIVVPNVLWIPIAQQRWHVFVTNAKAPAMELAVQMLIVQFSITERIVFVTKDTPVIHSAVAVVSFYVRICSVHLSVGLIVYFGHF